MSRAMPARRRASRAGLTSCGAGPGWAGAAAPAPRASRRRLIPRWCAHCRLVRAALSQQPAACSLQPCLAPRQAAALLHGGHAPVPSCAGKSKVMCAERFLSLASSSGGGVPMMAWMRCTCAGGPAQGRQCSEQRWGRWPLAAAGGGRRPAGSTGLLGGQASARQPAALAWSSSFAPGKSGYSDTTSNMTQPTPHMSIL
jgi:hypothetical protein